MPNIDIAQIKGGEKHGSSGVQIQMSDGTGVAGNVPKYASDGSLTDSGGTGGGGGGGAAGPQWVAEVPSGTKNGTNTTFTLTAAPAISSTTGNQVLLLFVNGLEQTPFGDFTLSGSTITMAAAPVSTDWLLAVYFPAGSSGGAPDPNLAAGAIGVTIDGGGSTPVSGSKGFVQCPYAGNITGWTMLADQAGSAQVTVKKSTYAGFPATSSIVASAPPALVSAQKNSTTVLTGWTVAVAVGDIFEFNLDSASTLKRLTLELQMTKA